MMPACHGIYRMCADFGFGSSRFPFRAQRDRQTDKITDAAGHPTHAKRFTAHVAMRRVMRGEWKCSLTTRKLCYRKDERAMRLIYECPESI